MKTDAHYRQTALDMAEQIRQHAGANQITEHQIAARTGLKQSNINRTLTGKYVARLDLLLKLCDAVGIDIKLVPRRKR